MASNPFSTMRFQFTPAALRALTYAAGWTARDGCDELEPPVVLLGLLAESECRAAITLARHGIDTSGVCGRWPEMTPCESPVGGREGRLGLLSLELQELLDTARRRMAEYADPVLATEHLLLELVAAESEVGTWLREQGLQPEALEAEIQRVYGYDPNPLPLEELADEEPRSPVEGERAEDIPQARPEPAAAERIAVLRAIDAAANRTREGLRVVEDHVRFVLDDRHLTGLCKQLRHELASALGEISIEHRLAARETRADVGTRLSASSEQTRDDTAGVLTANLIRLQEGLRSLEEFGKTLDPDTAARLKQLRYETYTLQRAVEITRSSIERLAGARLYVLIDGRSSVEDFRQLARLLIDAGVDVLQLRDKQLDDRELLERAHLLREMTRQTPALFIMNDRPDLAALSRADGVHVGQEDLSVKDARAIVGPDALIGVSTHSLDQARGAVLDGANYIGVGPTFPSGTKPFEGFPGPDLLRAVAAEIRLPAFAIGGITPENLAEVLTTGIGRVALSGAITKSDDPAEVVRRLSSGLR